jgi:hypothetical protein
MSSATQVAEALFRAHEKKETGRLTLVAGGRTAELRLEKGDLVGAELGFGHQTMTQALLVAGKVDPARLDALWARGEAGALEPDTLEELGTSPQEARRVQLLAQVRSLSRLAEEVRFESDGVEPSFDPIPGALAVRAAFEVEPDANEDREPEVVRCADVSRRAPTGRWPTGSGSSSRSTACSGVRARCPLRRAG